MYFIALVCPDKINEEVMQFKQWMKAHFGCTVALKSPAHITLVPPFWLSAVQENELKDALHCFHSDMRTVSVELNGFSHFSKRVLFVEVKENAMLEIIKKETTAYFAGRFGSITKTKSRPFYPHITIASRDLKPGDFDRAWEHFKQKDYNASFETGSIDLLKLNDGKWNIIGKQEWCRNK